MTMGDQDWGCLNTSMSDMAFRSLLVTKQLEFERGPQLKTRRGTTVVGKVKDEDIWIFNTQVQLRAEENDQGKMCVSRLKPDEQPYILLPSKNSEWEAKISLPLKLQPMKDAVVLMRTAFQHNFIPAMFVLGHGVVSMNAELVASRLDCCPVTVAVGASGLGKTMALKTALSMIGIGENGYLRQFKREAVVSLASRSTLGCYLDDPNTLENRKEAIVDFFGMGGFFTLSRGRESARCGLFMTANNPLEDHEERDLRRLIYIPFSEPKIGDTGGAEARVSLKEMRDKEALSSCVRTLVRIGLLFRDKGWREVQRQADEWARGMPHVLRDTLVNYSVLHWSTSKLCRRLGVPQEEVDSFWEEQLQPFIANHMQEPSWELKEAPLVLSGVRESIREWVSMKNKKELMDKVRKGRIKYGEGPTAPRVESLLVATDTIDEVSGGIPWDTIRKLFDASGEGTAHTIPYSLNEDKNKRKRYVAFKWMCFSQEQQELTLKPMALRISLLLESSLVCHVPLPGSDLRGRNKATKAGLQATQVDI
ncbi:uncharacterized protein LOC118427083 [Branchiostoma floridae]|uniref:Uncharacterized protein LOC118427083 n=1 Tax=Branchiostoma floridae TaxID=7739 RepID=A0A9J7N488_BRAFL|nr:uncharacterized protein LOC118427083 [Branchiostoma floridae]